MRLLPPLFALVLLLPTGGCLAPSGTSTPAPVFHDWSAEVFAQARRERRLVLLDLGTEWCHWCHVMAATTWRDDGVLALLARHYVAVAADADRRLDLAARYQDYGWPATIVFDADGRELWKNRGYVPPERMRGVLQRLADEPVPLTAEIAPATSAANGLSLAVRQLLQQRLEDLYDAENGGYGFVHKYLDADVAEWLLLAARGGDDVARARLLQLLDAERALIDPVWGGAYQYSHGGVWTHPHFEKVMARQCADLRAYSLTFGSFGRADDLAAAHDVARYLTGMMLAPEGAFFASQDADIMRGEHAADYFARDDAGRRRIGVPAIERSLWSRENGLAIEGLCALLAVAPDAQLQATVRAAAAWIVAHRRLPDGVFAHGEHDQGGPFLADTLAMTGALTALAELTHEREWLDLAHGSLLAIAARFGRADTPGFASAVGDGLLPPTVDRAENARLVRIAVRLQYATGDTACHRIAERALAFVAAEAVATQPGLPADLLLAAAEIDATPLHVVVVGAVDDPRAELLYSTALRHSGPFRLLERLLPGEPASDGTTFPAMAGAVAFVCGDGSCSPPITDPDLLRATLLAQPPPITVSTKPSRES